MRAFQIFLLTSALAADLNTTCTDSTQYFETSLMECASCGENKVANSIGLGCECTPGFAKTLATRDLPVFDCISCGTGASTQDDYTCAQCPSGIEIATNECACDSADYEIIDEKSDSGTYLGTKQCVACSPTYYPGPNFFECEACPDRTNMERNVINYACQCKSGFLESGDACVSTDQLSDINNDYLTAAAFTVIYNYAESTSGTGAISLTQSDTYSYFYYKSARDCNDGHAKSCQTLANLCVLQLYNLNTEACNLYKALGVGKISMPDDPDWKVGVGWIYYGRSTKDVLENGSRNLKVTFSSGEDDYISTLRFRLAQYKLDGTFLGFIDMTDQLLLCPHSSEDARTYREFGTNTEYNCNIELEPYLTADETIFYDLYMMDSDGKIIDVPVLIKNYRNEDDAAPNEESSESGWQLVRRFFIYDNVSGKVGTNSYKNGNTTTILTYLKSVKLRVTLRIDVDEMMYIPLLILNYRSRQTSYLEKDSTATISFVSEYTMDTSDF